MSDLKDRREWQEVLVLSDDDLHQVEVPGLPGDLGPVPAPGREPDKVEIERGAAVSQQPHHLLQGLQAALGRRPRPAVCGCREAIA